MYSVKSGAFSVWIDHKKMRKGSGISECLDTWCCSLPVWWVISCDSHGQIKFSGSCSMYKVIYSCYKVPCAIYCGLCVHVKYIKKSLVVLPSSTCKGSRCLLPRRGLSLGNKISKWLLQIWGEAGLVHHCASGFSSLWCSVGTLCWLFWDSQISLQAHKQRYREISW